MINTELDQKIQYMNGLYLAILVEGENHNDNELKLLIEFFKNCSFVIKSMTCEYAQTLHSRLRSIIAEKCKAISNSSYEQAHSFRLEELRLKQLLAEIDYFTKSGEDKTIIFLCAREIDKQIL